jgi:hypothetical protein
VLLVVAFLLLLFGLLPKRSKEDLMNWRNIIVRGLLTFVQAFLAVIIVTGVENLGSWDSLKPAVVASVAALLSFVYNVVKELSAKEGV